MAATSSTAPTSAALITQATVPPAPNPPIGGPSSQRPASPSLGQLYYDTTIAAEIVWSGQAWLLVSPLPIRVPGFGPIVGRPTAPYNGFLYFNTDLGGLESWNGSMWLYIGPTGPGTANEPIIVSQPASITVATSSSVSFQVLATGPGSLTYQWYFNGVAISGATANAYNILSVGQSQGGNYFVLVTGSGGSTQSQTAILTVTGAPYIVIQPTSQTVTAGQPVSFTIGATGTNPLTYQWFFESVAIPGANSPTYVISGAQAGNAGSYYCVVSNVSGSATSNTVTLVVNVATPGLEFTSLTVQSVASTAADCIMGFIYQATPAFTVSVSASAVSGNLPAGLAATAVDSVGNVIATATSDGSAPTIGFTVTLTGSSNATVVIVSPTAAPFPVQIAASASGSGSFINGSVRGNVYGPVLYPTTGYALTLLAGGILPGSQASALFADGTTTNPKSPPNFTWNLNGNTTQNPVLLFTPGNTVLLTGSTISSTQSDSRLDLDPPNAA